VSKETHRQIYTCRASVAAPHKHTYLHSLRERERERERERRDTHKHTHTQGLSMLRMAHPTLKAVDAVTLFDLEEIDAHVRTYQPRLKQEGSAIKGV
jgi:hypothetical protein